MGIRERLKVSKKLDPFLKGVWLPSLRASFKKELIDHVITLMKDNPFWSEDIAIKELGDARETSSGFKVIQRRVLLRFFRNVALGSIIGFPTLIILLVLLFLSTFDLTKLGANPSGDNYIRQIIEDQNKFAQYKFFDRGKEKNNAGKILNYIVKFETCLGENCRDGKVENTPMYHYSVESVKNEKDLMKVDASILKELLKYDYWDIQRDNPYFDNLFSKINIVDISVKADILGRPQWYEKVSRARLVQGEQNRDYLQTVKEVNHLCRLLYSREDIIGYYAARNCLRRVNKFVSKLPFMKQKELKGAVEIVPMEVAEEMLRLGYSQTGFLSVGTKIETLNQLFPAGRDIPLMCSSIEQAATNLMFDRYIYSKLSFVSGKYNQAILDLENFLLAQQYRCRISRLAKKQIKHRDSSDHQFSKKWAEQLIDQKVIGRFPKFLAHTFSRFDVGRSFVVLLVSRLYETEPRLLDYGLDRYDGNPNKPEWK